jgi:hypothetical protein
MIMLIGAIVVALITFSLLKAMVKYLAIPILLLGLLGYALDQIKTPGPATLSPATYSAPKPADNGCARLYDDLIRRGSTILWPQWQKECHD